MGPYLNSYIREHTHWLCQNSDCEAVNEVQNKDCTDCHERRGEGTEALNSVHSTIGELETVFPDGREHWVYFNGATSYARYDANGTRITPRINNRRHNRG